MNVSTSSSSQKLNLKLINLFKNGCDKMQSKHLWKKGKEMVIIILTLFLLSLDVLKKDTRRLNQLYVDQSIVQVEDAGEVLENVLLDQVVHKVLVKLLRVYGVLGNISNDLDDHLLVSLSDHNILRG